MGGGWQLKWEAAGLAEKGQAGASVDLNLHGCGGMFGVYDGVRDRHIAAVGRVDESNC